ncbi:hypothetical protein PhCBS80983_g04452 [Powellomyces hirtus]|uniref:HIT domain-containing protein n=1 Tax=Powellomyces hirtus TaxID=109895 RepID=A0A507E0J3_9FUNG|nr:hypothetical protein PhCBS80983_g04452 [Powellomyces hirtus]
MPRVHLSSSLSSSSSSPPSSSWRSSLRLLTTITSILLVFLPLLSSGWTFHLTSLLSHLNHPAFTILTSELRDLHIVHDLFCTQVPMSPFFARMWACPPLRRDEVGRKDSLEDLAQAYQDQQTHGVARHEDGCVFCRIVDGRESTARIVYQDDEFIAFHDINPSAQLHLLLIPRSHIPTIHSLTPTHLPLLTRMLERARTILHSHGFTEQQQQQLGFHVPPFTSVSHLHLHVLGLPYRGWLRSVKYPRRDSTWGWFVKGTVVERSLERARERGEKGGWRWGWV